MGDGSRCIELTVKGDEARSARAPLTLLTRIFDALQDAVHLMGSHHLEKGLSGFRGRVPQRVREECNLHLVATGKGSFVAAIALPESSQLSFPNGFPPDLGTQSLETLAVLLERVEDADALQVRELLPDALIRARTLRRLRDMVPGPGDNYRLEVSVAGAKPVTLSPDTRDKLTVLLQQPLDERQQMLLGRVVGLQIEPTRSFHITRAGRRIRCFFEPEIEPILLKAIGQLVEIRGRAQYDARGRLQSFPEVHDAEIITFEPIVLHQVHGSQLQFKLVKPLVGELSYDEGYIIIEHAGLGLFAHGETRTDALIEFQRDFEVLWEEYANAPERELTQDALDLKKTLRSMVEGVSQGRDV